jgi:hypothetical protein
MGDALLTAGDWDDNRNFLLYQNYLLQPPPGTPQLSIKDRVIIRVEDGSGRPVSNALVTISGASGTYLSAPTGSDGQLLFFPGADEARQAGSLTVSATPSADQPGAAPGTATLQAGQSEVKVTLAAARQQLPTGLDLAFVVDTTGSMGDEISYLNNEISNISQTIRGSFPSVDIRYGLVAYRDVGDEYVTRSFDFTSDLNQFQGRLSAQSAGGGGDYPEAMEKGAQAMNQLSWRTGNVARVAFLVADAPPHDQNMPAFLKEVRTARNTGIRIYPIGASGVGDSAEYIMRAAAEQTLGRYIFLTDDSGIGDSHEEPHIPCYEVQYLKNVMLRALSSELSGTRVPAAPGAVLRTVGMPQNGVCTLPNGVNAYL